MWYNRCFLAKDEKFWVKRTTRELGVVNTKLGGCPLSKSFPFSGRNLEIKIQPIPRQV